MFFLWNKKKVSSIKAGQKILLPSIKKQDVTTIQLTLEQGDVAVNYACFPLNREGYLVNNIISTSSQLSKENQGQKQAIQLDGSSLKFYMQMRELSDDIEALLIVSFMSPEGRLDEWGKGQVSFTINQQSWVWSFHGSALGSGCLLEMIKLNKEEKEGVWKLEVLGEGKKIDISTFSKRLAERPAKEEAVPAVSPLHEKIDLWVKDESLKLKKMRLLAPELIDFYGIAQNELNKLKHAWNIPARVILVLDHTYTIEPYYQNKQILELVKQLLAFSSLWNDMGEIELFLVNQQTYYAGKIKWTNYVQFEKKWKKKYVFDYKGLYGRAFEAVRKLAFPENQGGKTQKLCVKEERPTYVICIMMQDIEDVSVAQWQLRWASYEPVFWHFMAVTKQKSRLKTEDILLRQGGSGGDFRFLDQLSELDMRAVKNTGYFTVGHLGEYTPVELYEVMLKGYTEWLSEAVKKGMVKK